MLFGVTFVLDRVGNVDGVLDQGLSGSRRNGLTRLPGIRTRCVFFRIAIAAVGVLVLLGSPVVGVTQDVYESEPILRTSDILPAQLLRGPNHRVEERVVNDGFMNAYRIVSRAGDFDTSSTALLRIRIDEIDAIVRMAEVAQTDEFQEAIKKGGEGIYKGFADLFRDPGGTLKGAASGMRRIFDRIGESFRSPPSDTEDSSYKEWIGFATAKRAYAAEFGVDPYSTNLALQQQLNALAWAGYSGGILPGVATALVPVPGSVGLALTATKTTKLLNEMLVRTPPGDLRRLNREKLLAMGVHAAVAERFINNTSLSPRHQTILVGSLDQMPGVAGREAFVRLALSTDSEDVAFFRQRMAEMFAGYHRNVKPLSTFFRIDDSIAARTVESHVVIAAPFDHLAWTRPAVQVLEDLELRLAARGIRANRELWITGTASSLAAGMLKLRGWNLSMQSESLLLGG